MSNAAFTVVQNDMVILELWLSYYSRWFDDLHVMGNGTNESYGKHLIKLKAKYPFTFKRLPEALGSSVQTLQAVKKKQKQLFDKGHTWVLYSDCDEYLVPDFRQWTNFTELLEKEEKDLVFSESFNIYQSEDEVPIDYSKPYLQQRKMWFKDEAYNKPLLSRREINWVEGCHKEHDMDDNVSRKIKDTGLYLLHLKYADLQAQGRDFGPITTGVKPDYLTAGPVGPLEPIPRKIREAF